MGISALLNPKSQPGLWPFSGSSVCISGDRDPDGEVDGALPSSAGPVGKGKPEVTGAVPWAPSVKT